MVSACAKRSSAQARHTVESCPPEKSTIAVSADASITAALRRKWTSAPRPRTYRASCEDARHTVPSPLAGEGQGEGRRQSTKSDATSKPRLDNDRAHLLD